MLGYLLLAGIFFLYWVPLGLCNLFTKGIVSRPDALLVVSLWAMIGLQLLLNGSMAVALGWILVPIVIAAPAICSRGGPSRESPRQHHEAEGFVIGSVVLSGEDADEPPGSDEG